MDQAQKIRVRTRVVTNPEKSNPNRTRIPNVESESSTSPPLSKLRGLAPKNSFRIHNFALSNPIKKGILHIFFTKYCQKANFLFVKFYCSENISPKKLAG